MRLRNKHLQKFSSIIVVTLLSVFFIQPIVSAQAQISEYPIPTSGTGPAYITAGPDGNLWFTEYGGSNFGTIDPNTHSVTEYALLPGMSNAFGIVSGGNGYMYIAQNTGLASVNISSKAVVNYPLPSGAPYALSLGSGDGYLWFTELGPGKIGSFNLATHAIAEYSVPTGSSGPGGIVTGPDGNLWFTEENGNKIGMLDKNTHTFSEYAVPTGGVHPFQIANGPDGNIWFTEYSGNIGMINPVTKVVTEYSTPTPGANPYGIYAGTDGNIWFTENGANKIATIDVNTKQFTEYNIPTNSTGPYGITFSPVDGNIWFTEYSTGQIGTLYGVTGFHIPVIPSAGTGTSNPVSNGPAVGNTVSAPNTGFAQREILWPSIALVAGTSLLSFMVFRRITKREAPK